MGTFLDFYTNFSLIIVGLIMFFLDFFAKENDLYTKYFVRFFALTSIAFQVLFVCGYGNTPIVLFLQTIYIFGFGYFVWYNVCELKFDSKVAFSFIYTLCALACLCIRMKSEYLSLRDIWNAVIDVYIKIISKISKVNIIEIFRSITQNEWIKLILTGTASCVAGGVILNKLNRK